MSITLPDDVSISSIIIISSSSIIDSGVIDRKVDSVILIRG